MPKIISPALALFLMAVACGAGDGGDEPSGADNRPLVVATTSIIGDIVSSAFGDGVRVEVLVSGTQDPHSYRPSPEQVASLREADLVVANGLGLEEALIDILDASVADGAEILYLGDLIDPLALDQPDDHGLLDPHFWFDPRRMEQAIGPLGEALAAVAPTGAQMWREGAAAYQSLLRAVDADIREMVADIPETDRKLVTTHDSLRYFADAYGFTIIGTVIPGISTLAEPSASDLADVIGIIRTEGVRVIFADTTRPIRLAEVVAAEVGHDIIVVELFTGALGGMDTEANTYLGYLRTNARLIVQALGS